MNANTISENGRELSLTPPHLAPLDICIVQEVDIAHCKIYGYEHKEIDLHAGVTYIVQKENSNLCDCYMFNGTVINYAFSMDPNLVVNDDTVISKLDTIDDMKNKLISRFLELKMTDNQLDTWCEELKTLYKSVDKSGFKRKIPDFHLPPAYL